MGAKTLGRLGGVAIGLSLLLAALTAVQTFLKPIPGFPSSAWDGRWVGLYAGLFLLAVGLSLFRLERVLLVGSAGLLAALLLAPLSQPQNALALFTWLFLIYIFSATGAFCLRQFFPRLSLPLLDRWLVSSFLGMGGLAVLMFGLGIFQLYNRWLVWLLLAGIGIGVSKAWLQTLALPSAAWLKQKWLNRSPAGEYPAAERQAALGLALILIFLAGTYLWALSPAVRYDALSYHLAVPETYVRSGGMVDMPEAANTYWVHYAEMLYTLALLLAGQPLPGLIHFTSCLLSAGFVFALTRRLSSRSAWIAALLFCSIPLINIEAGSAYIELFLALTLLGTVYFGVRWWFDQEMGWLGLAGIGAGLAVGSKVSMIPLLAPLGLLFLWGLIGRRPGWKSGLQALLIFGLPLVLLSSVWFGRDWLWTGNPVFPMFNGIFRSSKWFVQGSLVSFGAVKQTAWLDYFLLPYTLVVQPGKFYHETSGAILAGVPLLAVPWGYWRRSGTADKLPGLAVGLWCASLLGAALVFTSSPNLRYLIPVYALWSCLAGLNGEFFLRSLAGHNLIWKILLGLLFCFYLFSTRLAYLVNIPQLQERIPFRVVLGLVSQQDYLSEQILAYDALQYLDGLQPAPRVLSVGNEFRLYTRAQIYGIIFSSEVRTLLLGAASEVELAQRLWDAGFEYVLVNEQERNWSPFYAPGAVVTHSFLLQYAHLEFSHNQVNVYRLLPPGTAPSIQAENLLSNPSFEALDPAGSPQAWTVYGNPTVVVDAMAHRPTLG